MKKKQFLKMLENLKDNDEIFFYNGFVDDYQDIDQIFEKTLSKQKISAIKDHLIFEWKRSCNDFDIEPDANILTEIEQKAKQIHKKSSHEITSDYVQYGDKNYSFKKVFLIQPKLREKKAWDRLGDIHY